MFMKFRAVKNVLCLAFAVVAAGAWDLHMLGPAHEAGESCQVCSVAGSPELNADCGGRLLVRPDNFVLNEAALPGLPAETPFIAAFLGRAPPR
ncbi:MAG TPA: hypothetical protein DCW72_10130 [Elusimicrobia bacterium]|nr:MAG: hypothetical protein A2X29_06020 [Elusimicrobia bacterium GWA2_64_40]OGR67087.1 MAG: hypothetical protein A2X30_06390 [Elusimicrobia bacterium GWB2_63_16]HAN04659.1 hypothetical protein [Elusimicrobiota bacterium]HAU90539.1 hypothetical protein [Elusimicrobiota bacterium]